MDRLTRKELKTDKFAVEVEHTFEYVSAHRRDIVRYGSLGLAVALIAGGVWYHFSRQKAGRQRDLAEALQVEGAPVGASTPWAQSFPTQQAKHAEAIKRFAGVASKYSGTEEGLIAATYLGAIQAEEGRLAEAEKSFKLVADSGNRDYGSLAQLSLAQIYFSSNRAALGEKVLRSLIENPTVFVSKEQATVALARALAATKPAEARKLLESLKGERQAVSQIALTLLAELPQ